MYDPPFGYPPSPKQMKNKEIAEAYYKKCKYDTIYSCLCMLWFCIKIVLVISLFIGGVIFLTYLTGG